jgi:hypothetical protein
MSESRRDVCRAQRLRFLIGEISRNQNFPAGPIKRIVEDAMQVNSRCFA